MKRKIIFLSLVLLYNSFSWAQMAVNTDGSIPNSSAMLDVKSTTKGILVPRMTAAERGLIASPATGLMVYQTNTPAGYYYYNGTAWKQIIDAASSAVNPPLTSLLMFDGSNWVSKNLVIGQAGGNQPVNIRQPYLGMNYCIALYGVFPSQSGINPYIGEVELFGFSFAPVGWAQCNGQLLSIVANEALFALLGTTYGGNGVTTFALPDLRGRNPIGQGTGPGLTTKFMGEASGSESITLTLPQIPQHNHAIIYQ